MVEEGSVLISLFVLFAAAKLLGELFEHLRQPAVVGELLGGVLVGPYVLGLVAGGHDTEVVLEAFAELGVIILMFTVGLETSITEMRRVGRSALLVGVLGVVLPFAAGTALLSFFDYEVQDSLFVAAALVATSVGVTARVLRDIGALRTITARVVLGAAVVDDILAIMVLAIVAGLAVGDVSSFRLVLTFLLVLAFIALVTLAGPSLIRTLTRFLHLPVLPGSLLVFALLVTLGLAALSETIGLAAIIGAFLAGLIFDVRQDEIARQVEPVYEFLVPLFFAFTGTQLDPAIFADPSILGLASAVTAIAIVTKVAGGYFGAIGLGRRTQLAVGVGMVPRGEVGLIVASLGLGLGVISGELYGVVVAMTVVTTLATPPILGPLVRRAAADAPPVEPPDLPA